MKSVLIEELIRKYYKSLTALDFSTMYSFYCNLQILATKEIYNTKICKLEEEISYFCDNPSKYEIEALENLVIKYYKELHKLMEDLQDNKSDDAMRRFDPPEGQLMILRYCSVHEEKADKVICIILTGFKKSVMAPYMEFLRATMEDTIGLFEKLHNLIEKYAPLNEHIRDVDSQCKSVLVEFKSVRVQPRGNQLISQPREMFKLAEENGYIRDRVTGDHHIFKHKDSHKIVVIPDHKLGRGLSFEIQKQINENKEVMTYA